MPDAVPTILDRALAKRAALLAGTDTDAVRLVHGAADGLPALTAEKLGDVLLVERHREDAPAEALVDALVDRFGAATPVFFKERWSREREGRAGAQVRGPAVTPEREIHEAGLTFAVRLTNEEHVGLFLDARDARAAVRGRAAGRRALNLFAYTGAFGAAAAAGGALATTNIDLMRPALAAGRATYERNGLPFNTRSFLRDDVFLYLRRAAKRDGRYDLVITDPPPLSRTRKGRRFEAALHTPDLVALAAAVMDPGALLVAGTNDRRLPDATFLDLLREGAAAAGRSLVVEALLPPPVDFPAGGDRPTARFALCSLPAGAPPRPL